MKYPAGIERISTALSFLAGIFLLALMVLTVADVAGRTFWNQSIIGTIDISTLLLVGVAFLGLASAEITARHVAVSIVEERLPLRVRAVGAALRLALMVFLGAVLVWGMGEGALSALHRGERTNDILRLMTWPAKAMLWISFVCFFIPVVLREVREIRGFWHGRVVIEDQVEHVLHDHHEFDDLHDHTLNAHHSPSAAASDSAPSSSVHAAPSAPTKGGDSR